MKKRIFFNKLNDMVYISHLDLANLFERILTMSDLKIKYSEGFNPRPKVSFGFPVSLGTEAYNEPVDIEFTDETLKNDCILNEISKYSPKGIEFTEVKDIEKSISKDYNFVNYEIIFYKEDLINDFLNILNQDEIIVIKESKGKIKERNLKENIKEFSLKENTILISLESISPGVILNILNTDENNYKIIRRGYI